jgi:hypothetical protein
VVHIFRRNVDNSIEVEKKLDLNTGVDNIEVDNNRLIIGAHPNMLRFVLHSSMGGHSPSQILAVNLDTFQVEDLFLDDGKLISGSSIGVTFGGKLLIGPALVGNMVLCE